MKERYDERTRLLLGDEAAKRLNRARVIVFGAGGVGGYAIEALARAGIGTIGIVDPDSIAPSNLNRQILATTESIGQNKAEAAAARIRLIAPACRTRVYPLFYLPETADAVDLREYDHIVDAIDTVAGKIELAVRASALGIPLISCMGTGNKLDASRFEVRDISETSVCPLARVMRRELKKRGIHALKVVFSREEPLVPAKAPAQTTEKRTPGSVSFVPGAAGLIAAGEVVRSLIGR